MLSVSVISKPSDYQFRRKKTIGISKPVSLDRFLNMSKKEDGYKYELVGNVIEKSCHNMTTNELKIVAKIEDAFFLSSFFKSKGRMVAETKIVLSQTPDLVRIPDISFFTAQQIERASETNFPIPAFVIELISANDGTYRVEKKILEYFEAGIKVIWVIYPQIKQVKVYTSPKMVTINYNQDICTASPVINDMFITVDDLFAN